MSHQYPTIKTVDDLRAFMASTSIKEVVTDADLIWFVCLCNARVLSDSATIKDLAHLYSEGVAKLDKLSDVQEFIDTMYEVDNDMQNEINALNLIAWVLNFYCKYEEEAQVIELMNSICCDE